MKWCDTNVLIRLLINDIPVQNQEVQRMVADAVPGEIIISDAVLSETLTVLEFNPAFRLPRQLILKATKATFSHAAFQLSDTAQAALTVYENNPKLDIVDCLLLVSADYKKSHLLTFDKALLKAAK